MDEFYYAARDVSGLAIKGTLRAPSLRDAARMLSSNGVTVTRLYRSGGLRKRLHVADSRFSMIFVRQLSAMLSSGLPLAEALRLLAEERAKSAGTDSARIVSDIYREVQGGRALSAVMREHESVFTEDAAAIVEAGELSGSLDRVMKNLAEYLESEYAAREKLITMMIYPMVLLFSALVVVVFLVQFIFPVFSAMFSSLDVPLPLPTRMMLEVGDFFSDYGWVCITGLISAALLVAFLYHDDKYQRTMDRMLLSLPVFGRLMIYSESMRFAGTMAILLGSGIIADHALEIVSESMRNTYLSEVFRRVSLDVQKGITLSSSMERHDVFPRVLLGLIKTGEVTGELEEMLERAASFCRAEADTLSERVRALVTPAALLVLGCVVGFVIFSITLPILDGMAAFM